MGPPAILAAPPLRGGSFDGKLPGGTNCEFGARSTVDHRLRERFLRCVLALLGS